MPPRRPPVRVVVDSELSLRPEARLASGTERAPTWLFGAPDAEGGPLVRDRTAFVEVNVAGMQVLLDHSDENGGVDALGIISGQVRRFPDPPSNSVGARLKVSADDGGGYGPIVADGGVTIV